MLRRFTVTLTAVLAAGLFATGAAAAAPVDEPEQLTPREQQGLQFAGQVLDSLFGGGPAASPGTSGPASPATGAY